ncbi:NAD(P)H-hydrate epimerase [Microbacterium sp. ZW T2_14]|uniref:NAD(P)H-hydrate epimerase n=1 Tax=Microbacterium sp. ZW T2_14 TaxID=3378079 RepID=UPI0038548D85
MTEWVPVRTTAQIRAAERVLLDQGVPLMLWAAQCLASITADELVEAGVTRDGGGRRLPGTDGGPIVGRVLVLAGAGDNGGDALYAAAALLQWMPQRAASAHPPADDLRIDVFCTSERVHEQALATALAGGARRIDLAQVAADAAEYDIVIDGILGIGVSTDPALRGAARDVVSVLLPHVRAGRPRVIAADVPSGLHPDLGATSDDVVLPASVTVTFGGLKPGLVTRRGRALSGAIVFVDFDLPFDEPPATSDWVAYAVAGRPAS